jgi:sugar/nucleoside kinase (ribokinase family)
MPLSIKPKDACRWDLISLGEVMLRFDPGEYRIWTARDFRVSEGGGEYNVARGLKRCFGLDSAIVTAFAKNPVGSLLQDLISQGGVDSSLIRWVDYDGVGRTVRNGLNFTERGFGVRAALGCSDRGHTAVLALAPGQIDWDSIFSALGARWFHTGGIFCALSESTPDVAIEAMQAARKHGVIVSYDLNYRESLWKSFGGKKRAQEVNRRIAPLVDVMLGNEEDFSAALGYSVPGLDQHLSILNPDGFKQMIRKVVQDSGGRHYAPPSHNRHQERLGRNLLLRWRFFPSHDPRKPRNPRSGWWWRLLRLGLDLWFPLRKRSAVGRRVRRRSWRSGHDHAGRHFHGYAGRSPASNERSGSENCPLIRRRLHT